MTGSWFYLPFTNRPNLNRSCSMNRNRKICSATQRLSFKHPSIHAVRLITYYLYLFWLRNWPMTSPARGAKRYSVAHHVCLSFSISGLQRLRNTDRRNESRTFRLPYNDNMEPTERPQWDIKNPNFPTVCLNYYFLLGDWPNGPLAN